MVSEQKARKITPVCLQCGAEGHVYTQCSQFFENLFGVFDIAYILAPAVEKERSHEQ